MGVAGNFRARHPLLSALILPMCGATLLVVVYFLLPLGRSFGGRTVVFLVVGLVAFGALVALQLAQISGSPYPRLRAITALATSVPLFLIVFATTYFSAASSHPHWFSEQLSKTDSLYFTMTVFSTVGFGDIVPKSTEMRAVVMVQMLGDLIVVGFIGRSVLGAVNQGLQRRPAAAPTPQADSTVS